MKYYPGLDVSMKEMAICVIDEKRKVVKEEKWSDQSPSRSLPGWATASILGASALRRSAGSSEV